MATVKKTTAKKTTPAKKAVVAKKPVTTKKVVTKAASPKKTATQPAKMRSFRVSPDNPTFTTFKLSRQTIYWIIIVGFIIFMQLWIISMQIETSNFIEQQMSDLNDQ